MTFDEWWDTTKANATPDTFAGWEASCRQAWNAAAYAAQAVAGQVDRQVMPAAEACPTCGSDCNERDELIKAEREIERLRADLRAMEGFAELWYFVSDEAPSEFERIVNEWSPARWLGEAHKLMKAKREA